MYLVNCRLLPELSGGVSAERGCVEIEDGRIAAVLPEAPEGAAEAFDCEGGTLLPGLIDLHTHITLLDGVALKCAADPMQVMVEAAAQAKRYLARGFTTIRDCGSIGRSANYVKKLASAGVETLNIFDTNVGLMSAVIETPSTLQIITGNSRLYEVVVNNAKFDGIEVSQIPFVENITISRIFRIGKAISPHGSTQIRLGDHILFSCDKDVMPRLRAVLSKMNE